MRAASAARWAEDELFNLKNAFDLQLKRLEVKPTNDILCCSSSARYLVALRYPRPEIEVIPPVNVAVAGRGGVYCTWFEKNSFNIPVSKGKPEEPLSPQLQRV